MDDLELYTDESQEAAIAEQRREDQVQHLGSMLSVRLRAIVQQREPIERRMIEDLRQYHGRYDAETEAMMRDPRFKRSKLFANITRSKTNAAEARIADMLFPADDTNWGIEPTPIPEMADLAKSQEPAAIDQNGQVVETVGDQVNKVLDEAKKRSKAMTEEIKDQLAESDYVSNARKAIHQAAVLGTGILKGPVIVNRMTKRWSKISDPATGESVRVMDMLAEDKPAVEWVDVWNFFPDMAATSIQDCEYVYERKFLTRKALRNLSRRPGMLKKAIKELIQRDASELVISTDHLEKLREIAGVTGNLDQTRYEMWEYHGPVTADDLRACGCDISDEEAADQDLEAVVMFIGDVVIFADINPMETEEHPYSVWQWEPDDSTIFGYGVPYLMRTPQRVMNSAWRMLMDNSGVAVGPQIAFKSGKVQPIDNDWQLAPMKMWMVTDPNVPVQDAFATFDINSHQAELTNIIQIAENFADKETSLPMLAQGEQGGAPNTATGMSMLMNAANTVLRRMVKAFDDNITKPLITRFYDWNMQFSENEGVKGDMQIEARGTTALMVKELQAQQMMAFLNFYANPVFAPILSPKAPAMLRKMAEVMRLNPAEVIPSEEEIQQMQQQAQEAAQQQQQPQDPRVQSAMIRADAEMKSAQYEAEANQVEMEVRKQMAEQDMAFKIQALTLEREIAMMKLSADQNLSLEKIKAQLAMAAANDQTKKQLFAAEREIKMATGEGI